MRPTVSAPARCGLPGPAYVLTARATRSGRPPPAGSSSRKRPLGGTLLAMTEAARDLRGVVRGNFIELDRDPGLPDGEAVVVRLEPVLAPGQGIRRSAGAWADDAEGLDEFLAEVRRSRHAERGAPDQ